VKLWMRFPLVPNAHPCRGAAHRAPESDRRCPRIYRENGANLHRTRTRSRSCATVNCSGRKKRERWSARRFRRILTTTRGGRLDQGTKPDLG
jgi:hypothetical protein